MRERLNALVEFYRILHTLDFTYPWLHGSTLLDIVQHDRLPLFDTLRVAALASENDAEKTFWLLTEAGFVSTHLGPNSERWRKNGVAVELTLWDENNSEMPSVYVEQRAYIVFERMLWVAPQPMEEYLRMRFGEETAV